VFTGFHASIGLEIMKIKNCNVSSLPCRDSSACIATHQGLGGPGIESRWGWDFSHGHGANPSPYTMDTGIFSGVKRQGRGLDHPPPSSAEVKKKVELYLYSTFGRSWPVVGWTFFTFIQNTITCYLIEELSYISFTRPAQRDSICSCIQRN